MKATHYYLEDADFYAAEYVIEDGKMIAYKILSEGCIWRRPDPENKYERFPKLESLLEIKE